MGLHEGVLAFVNRLDIDASYVCVNHHLPGDHIYSLEGSVHLPGDLRLAFSRGRACSEQAAGSTFRMPLEKELRALHQTSK